MTEKKGGMWRGLTSYGDEDFALYLRKAFIKAMGYSDDALSRPVIGITNTFSAYNACHANVPQIVEAVKRGVMLAGGMPMEFPTISLHESFAYPTSMYLRNLMSMDTEEMMRGLPMDASVLIGGCDKTVPAQLMAAASADIPSIQVVTGPMLSGTHGEERIGACTDCRRFWGEYRGGRIDHRDPPLFEVLIRITKPDQIDYVRDTVLAEIERMKTEPVDAQLLADTKSAMRYSFASGLNSPGPIAETLGHYLQLTGDPETVNRVYELYDQVTADDIQATAARYFAETTRTVVVLTQEAE